MGDAAELTTVASTYNSPASSARGAQQLATRSDRIGQHVVAEAADLDGEHAPESWNIGDCSRLGSAQPLPGSCSANRSMVLGISAEPKSAISPRLLGRRVGSPCRPGRGVQDDATAGRLAVNGFACHQEASSRLRRHGLDGLGSQPPAVAVVIVPPGSELTHE
jgi:hypothetical protein